MELRAPSTLFCSKSSLISLHLIRAPCVSGQLGGALRSTPRQTRARASLPPSHFGISPHRSLLRTPVGTGARGTFGELRPRGTRRTAARGPKGRDVEGSGAPSSFLLPISHPTMANPAAQAAGSPPRRLLVERSRCPTGARVDPTPGLGSAQSSRWPNPPPPLHHLRIAASHNFPTSCSTSPTCPSSSFGRCWAARAVEAEHPGVQLAAVGAERAAARLAAASPASPVSGAITTATDGPRRAGGHLPSSGVGLRPAAEHPRGRFPCGAQAGLAAEHPRLRIPSPSSSSSSSCLPAELALCRAQELVLRPHPLPLWLSALSGFGGTEGANVAWVCGIPRPGWGRRPGTAQRAGVARASGNGTKPSADQATRTLSTRFGGVFLVKWPS
jgi:hypothetical protein